jgi:uroporphyrinogen III methyltransferase/synthase
VHNLVKLLGEENYDNALSSGAISLAVLEGVTLAAIGPITAATVREYGFEPEIEAAEYTIDGLIAAITAYYSKRKDRE